MQPKQEPPHGDREGHTLITAMKSRKPLFMVGLVVITLGNAACGRSQSEHIDAWRQRLHRQHIRSRELLLSTRTRLGSIAGSARLPAIVLPKLEAGALWRRAQTQRTAFVQNTLPTALSKLRGIAHRKLAHPKLAFNAAITSCTELKASLPRDTGDLEASQLRKRWMGFAAGVMCAAAALVAASFSMFMTFVELTSGAGKRGAQMLAGHLATGARFGSAAARGELMPSPDPEARRTDHETMEGLDDDDWCDSEPQAEDTPGDSTSEDSTSDAPTPLAGTAGSTSSPDQDEVEDIDADAGTDQHDDVDAEEASEEEDETVDRPNF